MDSSTERRNWVTVGEVISLIKIPVALYTSHIVRRWHVALSNDCLPFGLCPNPANCQIKKKPADLCPSCNGWYKELAKSHLNSNKKNIEWHKNCDPSKWAVDPWEVAKFFMPVLGDNKSTVIDAESTDLSHLLNVLAWMKNVAFTPDRRVDLDLVRKFRSEVRNPWAHAPNQELTDAHLNNAFDIANKFVADLDNVFTCNEVKKCLDDIKFVQTNGITNVVEAELKALNSLRDVLGADVSQVKGETKQLKEDQCFDREVSRLHEKMVEKLRNRTEECFARMNSLQESKESHDNFCFELCRQISEIRSDIKSLQGTNQRFQLKSCLPDKTAIVFGRDAEVKKIISSLLEDGCGVVSIVGGPGFGKSTVAVEVSHNLCDNHDIIVIFSYLSNVLTVPDVISRLCLDVGVIPGEEPKSSLMFWLKNIDRKVVIVMDNIEQLLESNTRSQFDQLMLTLRKNSLQQLQILTTTRTEFSLPDRTTENVRIGELDEKSSVELLRTFCPNEQVEDGYLSDLANLCGFVPLALCITGSRIPRLDDPAELIRWLREKPMKALQSTDKSLCVRKAIEFSFQMLSDEDKKAFVRLSVFNGNFQKKSAEEVIERDGLETQDCLEMLVARSLIQNSSDKRFVIHSLIRRFLLDHAELQNEKKTAQGLMVKHFLKLCHSLTFKSYCKDGFTVARELLKKDGHNVEEVLNICSREQASSLNPNLAFLANSDIYKSSSRFFYSFSWDLLPQTVLRNFHEFCIELAKDRKQPTVEITFQCLMADQEGRKSAWKSKEYNKRMEAIKEDFGRNEAVLKEDRYLHQYCYYFYARYYSNIATNTPYPDLPDDNLDPSSENKEQTPFENADDALILIQRARLSKKRASKDLEKREEYMNNAKSLYKQALSSAKSHLGDHELTSICLKLLGDLYLLWRKNEKAMEYYSDAKQLSKKLQLDSNEAFVYLLKNYGLCFSFLRRFEDTVQILNEAREIVDKLAEKHTPCRASVYYELAKLYRDWKPDCQESAKYAKQAMEMQEFLKKDVIKALRDMIDIAEDGMKEGITLLQIIENIDKTDRLRHLRSRIPDKSLAFVGRDAEVMQITKSVVENGCEIVSIVGGSGFGKTTVAVEVFHHLSDNHNIGIIFSYFTNVSTVPEVILRLCRDVGDIPGEDPESSLMFWLRSLERKVVFFMDNIDQLLEDEVRSKFAELMLTLLNNSRQRLQIITTSRTEFSIPDISAERVPVGELDEKSSVELLRMFCPKQEIEDGYLSYLAKLCGFVPLALCLAGSQIPDLDDLTELIQWLKEKPIKDSQSNNKSQCVSTTIEFSFKKLTDEDRKALARLSVFNGNFQIKSAEEVIERDELDTRGSLDRLLSRCLIQRSTNKRVVIHSLIRQFLVDHDEFQNQRAIARGLMVKHFLTMCHRFTMDSFSKDGFSGARELLVMDGHNVEETLKVCQATCLNPNIVEFLVSSDIYKSSSRFFYRFARELLLQSVFREFHEFCIEQAKTRKQLSIEITFQCLVADQAGRLNAKSKCESPEYDNRMAAIKESLDRNKGLLKEDLYLLNYCYYFCAPYYSNPVRNTPLPDLAEDDLVKDENNDRSPLENAGKTLILIQRAQFNKRRAFKVHKSDKHTYEEYMICAESLSIQALSSAKEHLGDHELTCISHKVVGDIYLRWRKNKEALPYYSDAIQLSRKLQLDSSEPFVYLLKNCGSCLSYLHCFDESVKILKEALDIAEKLGWRHATSKTHIYCALARTYRAWKPDCEEAAQYASAAIETEKSLDPRTVKTMKD